MTTELQKKAEQSGLVGRSGIPGVEGLGGRHLTVPSIVLVQGTSSHFTTKGIIPGKYANTLTEKEVSDTSFVPAYLTEKHYVYDYEDDACTKKSLSFVADNQDDPRLEGRRLSWEDGKKPEVIPTIILAAILSGRPVKVAFKGASGYPAGMKLYTLAYEASNEQGLPLWGVKYKLTSYPTKNKKGDNYFKMDIEKSGIPEEKERGQAAELSNSFKTQSAAAMVDEVPF